MLLQAAADLDLHVAVLDPNPDAPAAVLTQRPVVGDFRDANTVLAFGESCELITWEIEHVNDSALAKLAAAGKRVYPPPEALATLHDKGTQKQWLQAQGFPTAAFALLASPAELPAHAHRLPAVQKLRTGGFDGRGVQVLETPADFAHALEGPCVLEAKVPFEKELAVLVARNTAGQLAVYDPVEMVFNLATNQLDYLLAPAQVEASAMKAATELGIAIAEALSYVGVLAVELFLTNTGSLLVNEIAPRVHNSGHHTIEACVTSQFAQHWRAVLGLPLGSTKLHSPAAMVNLVGGADAYGVPIYPQLAQLLALPGVYPHVYGKRIVRPHRKMGHVTVLGAQPSAVSATAQRVLQYASVQGDSTETGTKTTA